MELTEQIVETALYEGRSYMGKGGRKRWRRHVLWDDTLPGFGLRITSTNRKSFIVSYRADGKRRTKTLGTAEKLSLDEARRRAAELLASADESPRLEAGGTELVGVDTVAQLADTYLETHLKLTVPSWYADQRLISIHIKPALGRLRICEVTRTDLTNLAGRVGRRFPDDARRLRPLLTGMFDWAGERGLWAGASREADRATPGKRPQASAPAESPPEAGPQTAPTAPPKPRRRRSRKELAKLLEESESQRHELAERLEEVSTSGVEMLRKLNEQATREKELEGELAGRRREIERLEAKIAELPDPAKAEKQTANLRQSVEQLLETTNQAESERQEMMEKLAAAEARARRQSDKVVALARARNELESRLLEAERKAAIRKVQRKVGGGRGRGVVLLAAGAVAGVVLTLLLQRMLPPAGGPSGASPGGGVDPMDRPVASAALDGAEPAPASAAPAASTPAGGQEGGGLGATTGAGATPAASEASPDPAAAEAAVSAWAAAWSEQRIDDYLAAYSERFQPPDGLRRGEWAAQRRNRIQGPSSIRVTIGSLERTALDAERVRVVFDQSYETESYSDQVVKTLELVWEDGSWKILSERAG